MADNPSTKPTSRVRRTFWRKIKDALTPRSLPPINCKAIRVLLDTPSLLSPDKEKDESPISPISPITPITPISPVSSDTHTDTTHGLKSPKWPPVERAWYTDATLSPSFARRSQSMRESTSSSPSSSLETVRGRGPQRASTLRAISTPYLFPFPSTEPTARARCSTGRIWERVAEGGTQEEDHSD